MAKFEQRVDLNAPMDTVWAVLADASTWAEWFPDADSLTGLSSVTEGGTFSFQHKDKTGTATITSVDHDNGIVRVTTNVGEKQEMHTFDIDRRGFFGGGNKTSLKYTLEYHAGGPLNEFLAGGNPMDTLQVKHTLGKLRDLVEQRS